MNLNCAQKTLLRLVVLLCCLGLGYHPASAVDDWVLVERFENQLGKAEAGDDHAMYEVGMMYELGRGTQRDPDLAATWLQRAVAKGNDNARARLGALYYEGKLLKRDLGKARSLLQTAAEANVPSAQFHLGQMYEAGDGVDVDPEKALHWYKLAATGGYYEAREHIRGLNTAADTHSNAQPVARASQSANANNKTTNSDLLSTLLNGNWQRNNRSAGFLPSGSTKCERLNGQKLRCRSEVREHKAGDTVVSYMTQAVLTRNGRKNQFEVLYRNTVLNTTQAKDQPADADEDASAAISVSRGQQTEHALQCTLKSANTVVCIKDKIATQTFNNAARAQ